MNIWLSLSVRVLFFPGPLLSFFFLLERFLAAVAVAELAESDGCCVDCVSSAFLVILGPLLFFLLDRFFFLRGLSNSLNQAGED